MFGDFLYLLRRSGLKISLTEWMALMEALDKGLEGASLTGFYYLCRGRINIERAVVYINTAAFQPSTRLWIGGQISAQS